MNLGLCRPRYMLSPSSWCRDVNLTKGFFSWKPKRSGGKEISFTDPIKFAQALMVYEVYETRAQFGVCCVMTVLETFTSLRKDSALFHGELTKELLCRPWYLPKSERRAYTHFLLWYFISSGASFSGDCPTPGWHSFPLIKLTRVPLDAVQ